MVPTPRIELGCGGYESPALPLCYAGLVLLEGFEPSLDRLSTYYLYLLGYSNLVPDKGFEPLLESV